MEESGKEGPLRLITLSDEALIDLSSIDLTTAIMWGDAQAERYLTYLWSALHELAENPARGRPISERTQIFSYVAKYSGSRMSNGHRIFYRFSDSEVEVARILHTAMYWPDVIAEDD